MPNERRSVGGRALRHRESIQSTNATTGTGISSYSYKPPSPTIINIIYRPRECSCSKAFLLFRLHPPVMVSSSPTTVTHCSTDPSDKECSKEATIDHAESIPSTFTDGTVGCNTGNIVRDGVVQSEIPKQVLRQKLRKFRHLVLPQAISPTYLDFLFPQLLEHFHPQTVHYNGGIAQVKEWKISCYLEVMEGGIPCTNPNLKLLQVFQPLLDTCNDLFLEWYRQQHSCNTTKTRGDPPRTCRRLMTFVTRYTPAPGEQALLKVRYYRDNKRFMLTHCCAYDSSHMRNRFLLWFLDSIARRWSWKSGWIRSGILARRSMVSSRNGKFLYWSRRWLDLLGRKRSSYATST